VSVTQGRVWAGSDSAQAHVSCLQLVSWLPNRQQLTLLPPSSPTRSALALRTQTSQQR